MNIREASNKVDWNTFLLSVVPNTFLQSWEWGQVQKLDGETVRYLGLFADDKHIGAGLVITVNARRGKFLLCPHGPIFLRDEDVKEYLGEFVEYCKNLAKQDGAVVVRIAPLLIETPEHKQLFSDFGFCPAPLHVHAELTWVLDITPSEEDILSGMRKTTRHAIRRAEKEGVTVELSENPEDIARFFPLYETTRSRHDFVPFSESFLRNQVEVFGQEGRALLAFAKYKNEDVTGAIFMKFGNTIFYHHGASKKLAPSVPATQLLHWETIRHAKQEGMTQYNFWGIARDDQPNHPFAGITTFKKGFGGTAINYMHAQDLPTSLGYWKLWLVEMIRKYRRGFN